MNKSLDPSSGTVTHHRNLKYAFFTQHHIQQLDLELTPMEHLQNFFPTDKVELLRSQLAKFGICDYMPLQKMKTFSGGERSRVKNKFFYFFIFYFFIYFFYFFILLFYYLFLFFKIGCICYYCFLSTSFVDFGRNLKSFGP